MQPPANPSVPRGGHRPKNARRRVAPGTPFVTRQKISAPAVPPAAGLGPTIAQLNAIQRLRDQTRVLVNRPVDRAQADRQIAALRAYLEDDLRAELNRELDERLAS